MWLLFLSVVLLAIIIWVPIRQVRKISTEEDIGKFNRENEARKTIAQIVGGGAAIFALFTAAAQIRVSQTQLALTEQGQSTSRMASAVNQLGDPRQTVRLGGIVILERIARDSEPDRQSVFEILSAFVRESAPWPPKHFEQKLRDQVAAWKQGSPTIKEGRLKGWSISPIFPSEQKDANQFPQQTTAIDHELVLKVIGRGTLPSYVPDLNNAYLPSSHVGGSGFKGANFFMSYLGGAYFRNAALEAARFDHSHLAGAIFENSKLAKANFDFAYMPSTGFWGGCILKNASFAGADLSAGNFSDSDMEGTNLSKALVNGTDFSRVKGLTQLQIESAWGSSYTKLPATLTRPRHWEGK